MPNVRRFTAMSIAVLSTAFFVTACSSDTTTGPAGPIAAAAKGAPGGGGGGGGTAVPPPAPVTTLPTINVSATTLSPLSESPVSVTVIALSDGNTRKAPVLTVSNAPDGFTVVNFASVDSPHGGGPGHVIATYSWTPTRAQIGLAAHPTFVATTAAGSATAVVNFAAVQDAPGPVNGLTAITVNDHVEVRWQAVDGGIAPIMYSVSACYRNANIRPGASTCGVVATTTAPEALNIPVADAAPTVAPAGGVATYTTILVTAQDAAGNHGTTASATIQ
jgi:hypothetical protein